MLATLDEILLAALRLSPQERELLAVQLLDAPAGEEAEEIAGAWADEAQRRLELVREGELPLRDGAEVFRELERRYAL